MTKTELASITENQFAHTALQFVDDELTLVGKFSRSVYLGDGNWDVWLCNPKDLHTGLSNRKIGAMSDAISEKTHQKSGFRRLDGEGVYPKMPTADLLLCGSVLGIRKRMRRDPLKVAEAVGRLQVARRMI